eukprot:scaffold101795_cov27-Phaeocystis_antarctica.AAC.2
MSNTLVELRFQSLAVSADRSNLRTVSCATSECLLSHVATTSLFVRRKTPLEVPSRYPPGTLQV